METSEYNSHSDEWAPSLTKLIEAVENEDHPHHDQAVKRNRELAERMKPLLETLKTSLIYSLVCFRLVHLMFSFSKIKY